MKIPVRVTVRNITPSEELDTLVRERIAKLETYYAGIVACRVLVEVPHHHHEEGNRYHVRIDLTVPGEEIVVTHEPRLHRALQEIERGEVRKAADVESTHKYVEVAVREAFDIARRRLQDYVRRRRGAVKVHEAPAHGKVTQIGPDHGWIETPDGTEVYFHADAVPDQGFDRLEVGREVAFVEETGGTKGLQASTVRLLGKHHYP